MRWDIEVGGKGFADNEALKAPGIRRSNAEGFFDNLAES